MVVIVKNKSPECLYLRKSEVHHTNALCSNTLSASRQSHSEYGHFSALYWAGGRVCFTELRYMMAETIFIFVVQNVAC